MELSDLKCIDENINVEEYLDFYQIVRDSIEDPEWLGLFTKEKILNILKQGGKIWIYYYLNEIVCSFMYIPADKEAIDLFDININLDFVGECGPIIVSPKYRGNGLQIQMLNILEEYCVTKDLNLLLTTIHPNNIYSINNFIKKDYKFIKPLFLNRGKRNLYVKELGD